MKCMLYLMAELREHSIRDVARVLGDKVHADALRADELHHLLDLLDERLRCAIKKKVGLIEEEDHLRLLRVPDLRHLLEKLAQHEEHEGRVDQRILNRRLRVEDIDHATADTVRTEEIRDVDRRFTEERITTGGFKRDDGTQNRIQRGRRHIAILG